MRRSSQASACWWTAAAAWADHPASDRRKVHFPRAAGTFEATSVAREGRSVSSISPHDDTQPFSVEDEEIDATTHVVNVAGEVDLYSAPELKERVLSAIDAGKTRIVVDLSKTTFIDSTTLGVLVGARK